MESVLFKTRDWQQKTINSDTPKNNEWDLVSHLDTSMVEKLTEPVLEKMDKKGKYKLK